MNVSLLPKQKRFLQSVKRLVVFLAGIGSGKTRISAWWAILRAMKGRRIIILEPTFGMVRDVFLPTLREVLEIMQLVEDEDYVINLSDFTLSFPKFKGEILMRSADAVERLRGINADDGLIDEFGSLLDETPYKILIGRLRRSADAEVRLVGTPTQVKWMRDIVNTAGDDAEVIRQSTIENVFLPKSYIETLKAEYGEDTPWYKQEVLGELVDFGSGIFETSKIIFATDYLHFGPRRARAWDMASSGKETADYSATAMISRLDNGDIHVHDVQRKKGAYGTLRDWMIAVMVNDGHSVTQWIENTQAGQVIMSDLMSDSRCHSLDIRPVAAVKDKVTRALPLSARMSLGKVKFGPGLWHRDCVDELNSFPKVKHDDQVDALSHAYNALDTDTDAVFGSFNIY